MAGKSHHTEAEKANVFVVLTANGGNVKRTARETGIPENTVRRWKTQWQQDGPPSQEAVTLAADSFLKDAERIRHLALMEMETKIPDAKLGELNAVVGTLTDKINLIRGHATARNEHTLALPSKEEMRDLLAPALNEALALAAQRQEEIIDAEVVEEVRELPRTT